ncbi:hypothetical protein PV783_21290 [Chitinophaga sp. CC14]|uniref:hypothetical protein n=1 Tax=Chitinophaga sp. CC14 TaxID=3029199 RepID=UPI003B7EE492
MKWILVILACFSGCNIANEKHKIDSDSQRTTQVYVSDEFGKTERKEVIDSLKWIFYSLNYEYNARHYIHSNSKLKSIECDLRLRKIVRIKDTSEYYFLSYSREPSEIYLIEPDDYIGIATVDGRVRYTIGGNFTYDKPVTSQAADSFFRRNDSLFINYIIHYKGAMNGWLKSEVDRRRIVVGQ